MPAGTVEVFLIGATGIKDTEIFGKADPYAILHCGKQKLRSNTASNQGSKPVWNQKFSFYIDDTAVDLQVKIFNHNIFKEDDELGSTKIPLSRVFAESKLPTTTYNVVRPSGRVQGEVKLSIAFTAKYKTGQQPPQNVPGPYNTKAHGSSPYKATPPAPTVKHDPLTGPHGYYKNPETGSSHGGSKSHSFASDSDLGSSKPYPSAGMYPPMPAVNETPGRYQHTNSSPSFNRENSSSSSFGSSHGRPYHAAPAPPSSSDYTGSVYHESPYGHSPHGVGPHSPAPNAYPGTAPVHDSSYPPHSGGNPYDRVDDLSGRFGSMNVSQNEPHGSFSGYHSMPSFSNDRPPSGYPPLEPATSGHHHYPPPPPPGQPGGGYPPPPPGYSPQGYPPQFNSGPGSYPGSHSFHGYQGPPASFYPPELGVSHQPYGRGESGDPPSSNAYPPVPYYNAGYVPAGYPK